MPSDQAASKNASLWRRFLAFKSLLVAFSFVGLLASNVASLVSASAHDWMYSALSRVLSIPDQSFAHRVLANSTNAKTKDLEKQNKILDANNRLQARELDAAKVRSQKLAQQLDLNGKEAKKIASGVRVRLAKGVTRNLASIPGEAVPYLGIGVNLAVTSLDIYDACQTMKDFNALLRMMGQGEEHPNVCGMHVPTVDQAVALANSSWRSSVEAVKKEAEELKMQTPEVRLPTKVEVAKSTCPLVYIPGLCTGG
jgi:hypothetical protein